MNVTSMWSQGYLQLSQKALDAIKNQGQSASLALQEQQILAQERALKAKSADSKVSTVYHYSIGPNGRRYITGAEVTIEGDEQAVDRVAGGVKREGLKKRENDADKDRELDSQAEKSPVSEESDANQAAIQELKQIEQEVIAHEAAHQAAGGRFAGAVSYSYTEGPDGKRYITGGEVPIHVPASDDPEQTLRDMEQVQRAALAPGNPSAQDRSVAASAAAAAAQARQQLALAKREEAGKAPDEYKTGASSIQAGLRFEAIQSRQSQSLERSSVSSSSVSSSSTIREVADLYVHHTSKYGLWAWGRGFEPTAPDKVTPENRPEEGGFALDFAA